MQKTRVSFEPSHAAGPISTHRTSAAALRSPAEFAGAIDVSSQQNSRLRLRCLSRGPDWKDAATKTMPAIQVEDAATQRTTVTYSVWLLNTGYHASTFGTDAEATSTPECDSTVQFPHEPA